MKVILRSKKLKINKNKKKKKKKKRKKKKKKKQKKKHEDKERVKCVSLERSEGDVHEIGPSPAKETLGGNRVSPNIKELRRVS